MKKFLSLILALVMAMSLVTVSAGAKDFADADNITYDEAVSVISTIGGRQRQQRQPPAYRRPDPRRGCKDHLQPRPGTHHCVCAER